MRMSKIAILTLIISLAATILSGCSSTKHVPEGKYLLDEVSLQVTDSTGTLTQQSLIPYIRQRPNNKFLHLSRLRLGVYNMSGNDSTKWWNKWIRRLGEAPVIYDSRSMRYDSLQLINAMRNAGFINSEVRVDTILNPDKRKIKVNYNLLAGTPYKIGTIDYNFPNDTLREIIMRDSTMFLIGKGDLLDRNRLETQREMISERLRNEGFWAFSKEYITFNADTTEGSKTVDLTMIVHPPYPAAGQTEETQKHLKYVLGRVMVLTDIDGLAADPSALTTGREFTDYKGMEIFYGNKRYLRPSVIYDNCYLRKGEIFRQEDLQRTYSAFGRLPILKFIQIRLVPAGTLGDLGLLDAYVMLTPVKSQSIALEVEGTNSEGDLGFALGINYTHRNIGHGSETLNAKLRGSYQALNGDLEGFIHDRFMEYGAEVSLTFPKFKAPFLRESFKKKVRATTDVHVSLNYQERPEYTRIISTAGWSYKWVERGSNVSYTLTPIDINYVYLPNSTNDFIDKIAPDNPLLRYSYEDHFIMRLGFNYYFSNKVRPGLYNDTEQKDIFTLRAQTETAGNLLFAISRAIDPKRDFHVNPYKIFGIQYSEYVRGDADFSYLHTFDKRNSIACYAGFGIGVPYGNSYALPFEKRFYGGGANGVRGWSVRTLGPGRFPGTNSVSDFIYQCGDIRLNFSIEYRAKLFWVVEAGVFIDAGNIWTIRDYPTQPYGVFRFDEFYKEFATSYGAGIRLDFNYFLVRFDLGMKAHNPAINQDPWPLIHPVWGRDHAFHFSIGYPF